MSDPQDGEAVENDKKLDRVSAAAQSSLNKLDERVCLRSRKQSAFRLAPCPPMLRLTCLFEEGNGGNGTSERRVKRRNWTLAKCRRQ